MGIRSTFSGDFEAIDLGGMADDMLAEVVADHAAQRFRSANRANAVVAGGYVPYSVEVDGRTVHRGAGELMPAQSVALAIRPRSPLVRGVHVATARRLPVVVIDWAWDRLNGGALQRAIETFVRVDSRLGAISDAAHFARIVLNARDDAGALFRYLLLRYAAHRYPQVFARVDQARTLYRVYRLARIAGGLLGGDEKDRAADPDVLAWIASELIARSPVVSGGYRDSHALYGDGKPLMAASAVSPDAVVPVAEEYSFTNTVPYARKIELGQTRAGRDFVIQVPNRIYERVAEDARQRFRGLAEIRYEVRAVINEFQTPQRHAWRPHNRPAVRYPSIVVRFG